MESQGKIQQWKQKLDNSGFFRKKILKSHDEYIALRNSLAETQTYKHLGGIGGIRSFLQVKCLHAHYAHYAAGHDNIIGLDISKNVEPLLCKFPCFFIENGQIKKHPRWQWRNKHQKCHINHDNKQRYK